MPHLLQGSAGVGPRAVQLVDEGEEGDVVALHLSVHRHGLTLDPPHRTQDQHGAVQHPQRSLHFDGEVHVTCSNNVDSDVQRETEREEEEETFFISTEMLGKGLTTRHLQQKACSIF